MTIAYRYNRETMAMEAVTANSGNGGNSTTAKWWLIPSDVVDTLLRYAKEDKMDLGDPSDSDRAIAAAQGRARNLFLEAALRAFIAQRDAKAKAEAEAKAKAEAEVKPAAQKPPVTKPSGDGKPQGAPKQTQLVR